MDGRCALNKGTKLTLHNSEGGLVSYIIQKEIGRGGSCIVYDASYTDNLGNPKLVRVKECYPHALKLTRREDGSLEADERDQQDFEIHKCRLIDAYQQNHDLFSLPALSNYVSNTSDIYEQGGTVYIVSTWSNSETLEDHHCMSLRECALLLASAGRVVQRIHEAGYLYLDLKPENILTITGSTDLVQLFDFDSMVSMADLAKQKAVRASYTKGFAPLEQQTGKLRKLGWHSDVYSLGAVLFYEMWGHTPTAFDCDTSATFDFERMAFAGTYQDRLYRELNTDVSLRVEDTDSTDRFKVSGRGELHLSVLIENMRREGYEFAVSKAEVLYRYDENGKQLEPMEEVQIDVPEEFSGAVIQKLSVRKGELISMAPAPGNLTRLVFSIPSRGLIGYRGEFLTDTRGNGIMNQSFTGYEPFKGPISYRGTSSLIAFETGEATAYGIFNAQDRGLIFVQPGDPVYAGQVIGENPKTDDIEVNICKTKHLTNTRASGSDEALKLVPAKIMSLEQCMDFIDTDELLEITPKSLRIRKKILDQKMRKRSAAQSKN